MEEPLGSTTGLVCAMDMDDGWWMECAVNGCQCRQPHVFMMWKGGWQHEHLNRTTWCALVVLADDMPTAGWGYGALTNNRTIDFSALLYGHMVSVQSVESAKYICLCVFVLVFGWGRVNA